MTSFCMLMVEFRFCSHARSLSLPLAGWERNTGAPRRSKVTDKSVHSAHDNKMGKRDFARDSKGS